jgi:prevent-host-death family protein
MTRTITTTEANQRFAEILRHVDAGDSFTVTRRGRPVAEITPPRATKQASKAELEAMFARMDQLPGLVTGPWTRDELYDR